MLFFCHSFVVSCGLFAQSILRSQFLKLRKGILDRLIGNTVCQPHISRAGKGASRNHEDIVFLAGLTELFLICDRRFHEQVKSSLWFDALKSTFCQSIVKCQTVSVISCNIYFCIHTFLDDFLHQGRCIDTSEYTVCDRCCCDDGCAVFQLIRNDQITDTLTRQRQRFTVGISYNRILVVFRQIRNFYAVISQLSVWLLRNQIDHRTELLLFFLQDRCKFFDSILGINDTCRIVRCIYDHCTSVDCNFFFQFFKVRLKGLCVR